MLVHKTTHQIHISKLFPPKPHKIHGRAMGQPVPCSCTNDFLRRCKENLILEINVLRLRQLGLKMNIPEVYRRYGVVHFRDETVNCCSCAKTICQADAVPAMQCLRNECDVVPGALLLMPYLRASSIPSVIPGFIPLVQVVPCCCPVSGFHVVKDSMPSSLKTNI